MPHRSGVVTAVGPDDLHVTTAAQTRHRDLDTLIEHHIGSATALSTSTSADLGL